ncbi:protein regulator of cytokinesis 1-like [Styela clava]
MPRKSEVMQMDLQRKFNTTMSLLREIWDEIGIPDEQIEIRGSTVALHIENLLAGMVNEEKHLKKTMLESIEKYRNEITDISEKLSLPDFTSTAGITIMQQEKELRVELNKLKKLKHERLKVLKELQLVEQKLCDQLCSTPYYVPTNSIPSDEQLTGLKEHINTLEEEKKRRWKVYRTKKSQIVCLYDELELVPETSFAQDLITEMEDSFALSTNKMDDLADLHRELSKKKTDMELVVQGLWSQIQQLWERLEIDEKERKSVRDCFRGIKPSDIEGLRKELFKLEELKRANIQKLTERSRSDIAILWDKCYYSKDQRHAFSPAYEESYTEELLNLHEEELTRLHAYYEEHKEMFSNVGKWQQLFYRMLDLESKARDVNRYANRGGNLLQEERERKKIHKQLPKIEEELFKDIDRWEQECGSRFLVEGIAFREYVHSQWEACEQRKENEKYQRLVKKKQEMESEMVYGSTPKTPTKRRFIGTTTILKTPTDPKKARRGGLDNTCRSVLTHHTTNINRTAATCLSPSGKPPLSRLRTPISATKKARIPRTKTPKKQDDAVSIKSAPANHSRKTSLSTTVVSSSTTSSAKSAPLFEADPSHYNDFAKEINNQAKQNKAVRSSAIYDFRR